MNLLQDMKLNEEYQSVLDHLDSMEKQVRFAPFARVVCCFFTFAGMFLKLSVFGDSGAHDKVRNVTQYYFLQMQI